MRGWEEHVRLVRVKETPKSEAKLCSGIRLLLGEPPSNNPKSEAKLCSGIRFLLGEPPSNNPQK